MKKMIKYPSIGQFRNVVKTVRDRAKYKGADENGNAVYFLDHEVEYPVIEFTGTVKLHGTNASIAYNDEAGYWPQARNRMITVDSDNAGFAFFVESLGLDTLNEMFSGIVSQVDTSENTVLIYGEWCGGNIQKGVALNGLDKMFVMFGVKVTPHDTEIESYWLKMEDCDLERDFNPRVHDIRKFGTWTKTIDFSDPSAVQNDLVDLTLEVEKECPAGKFFGRVMDEDNTTGEGIVWSAYVSDRNGNNSALRFKVKGEKHSTSKVKKLVTVDPEKMKNINEFVDYAVTENRLRQGIDEVFTTNNIEPDMKFTGDFIKWVKNDVFKEEMDVMVKSNLEARDVVSGMSKKIVAWYKEFVFKV